MSATLSVEASDVTSESSVLAFAPSPTRTDSAPSTESGTVRHPEVIPFPSHPDFPARNKLTISPRDFAHRIATCFLIGDWIFASIAIFSALSFREWQVGVRLPSATPVGSHVLLWSAGTATIFLWIMMLFRTYETANLFRVPHFIGSLVRSVFLWSMALWACFGLFRVEGFTPRVGAVYCMFSLIGFIGLWRAVAHVVLKKHRIDRVTCSRVLMVGWNAAARHLRDATTTDFSQLGMIVGYVPSANGTVGTIPPRDLKLLGDYAGLSEVIGRHAIDSIVLADLTCPATEVQRLITFCQREMIGFQLIPNYFPALNAGLQVKTVSGIPLLGVNELPLDRTLNRAVKRSIDIVGSLIGIAVSSLIVPWFCALVFIESPGSVIYRQRRISRSGRIFYIYKIRSMHLNAETKTGAVWCKREDARRLRIGTFMRKWNIDELPQFVNVLKGEMSLVGPRPERPELIARFKHEIPNYNARHEVRSGLTGWAQVQGLRGDTDLTKRIEADLYYLENWSVFLDLYCLAATLFKAKNAH